MKRTADEAAGFDALSKRARPTDPANPNPRHDSTWAPGLSSAFYGGDFAASSAGSGYNPFAPSYEGYSAGMGLVAPAPGTGLGGNIGAGYGFGGLNTHNLVVNTAQQHVEEQECSSARTSFTIATPDAYPPDAYPPGPFMAPKPAASVEVAPMGGADMRMELGLADGGDPDSSAEGMMLDTPSEMSASGMFSTASSMGTPATPPLASRARAHTVPTSWSQESSHPLSHSTHHHSHSHHHHRHHTHNPFNSHSHAAQHPLGHAYGASHAGAAGTPPGAHPGAHHQPGPLSPQGHAGGVGHDHALREPRPLQPLYPQRPAATPLQPRRVMMLD